MDQLSTGVNWQIFFWLITNYILKRGF